MIKWSVAFTILFMAAVGCSSTPSQDADPASDQDILGGDLQVSDFEDESLFEEGGDDSSDSTSSDSEADGNAALDTGDDDWTDEPFPSPSDEVPEAKSETDAKMAEKEPVMEEAEPKPAPNPKAKPVKKVAKRGKAATRRTKSDCNMRAKPTAKASKLTMVPKGRKIWTEPAAGNWYKVYRKKGVGYLSRSCF